MSKQRIELSLVRIELPSKTLLHCTTSKSNNTNWDKQCSEVQTNICIIYYKMTMFPYSSDWERETQIK